MGYIPHSLSGASQVTLVDPLYNMVRLRVIIGRICSLPVVPSDSDGGAAQTDRDIEATEVKAQQARNGGSRAAG